MIRKKLKECKDPIVVFVWFKETAYSLQKSLSRNKIYNLDIDIDSDSISNESDENEIVSEDFDFNSDSDINCVCFTGDIIKQEVNINIFQMRYTFFRVLIDCKTYFFRIKFQQIRQAIVDRFQNGDIDVLICTFGVGSTGWKNKKIYLFFEEIVSAKKYMPLFPAYLLFNLFTHLSIDFIDNWFNSFIYSFIYLLIDLLLFIYLF